MSNVSSMHDIRPYISGDSKPLDGQVLLKVISKGRNGKPAPYASQCVSAPPLADSSIRENLDALFPHIRAMLHSVRQDCVRAQFEAGSKQVSTEQVGISAVLEMLEIQAKGTRLTADDVKTWFAEEMEEALILEFSKRLGISETPSDAQMKKLEQSLNVFRDGFAALASGKTEFAPKKAETFRTLLQATGAHETAIGVRFDARLQKMVEGDVGIMEALGF